MKILAFMQNMWVNDPERVKRLIAKYGDNYRRRLIAYALFAGCTSGRNLKATFGWGLCQQIEWEEASPEITGIPNVKVPADPAHINAALAHHNPDVVICFGRIACDAVQDLWKGPIVLAPHPAARQPDNMDRLRAAAAQLRRVAGIKPTHDPIG